MLDGLAAGAREIVVAEGRELAGLQMRATNPELVFAALAGEGARLLRCVSRREASFLRSEGGSTARDQNQTLDIPPERPVS
jgi:hypothetical protein